MAAELGSARRIALIGLLVVIWGSTWAVIKIGLRGIPPFSGVALRFTIAGVILLILFRPLGGRLEKSGRERWMWGVNSVLTFSISYGTVYWAEQWLPSGLTSILFATFPLFVAAFAHLWLPGESLTPGSVAGLLLGFIGVLTIFSEDLVELAGHGADRAALVMLLSPLTAAVGNVVVKRWGRGLHPLSLTAIPMLLTGGLMGALAATVEAPAMIRLDASSVGSLLYLSVFGTAVTFSLYFWLLERTPVTHLSLIAYLAPLMAVLIGSVFLDEELTIRTMTGAGMVVFGVALSSRRAGSRRPAGPSPPTETRPGR